MQGGERVGRCTTVSAVRKTVRVQTSGARARFAATDDAHPGVVGYGATPDEAERALEEKLPRRPPPPPSSSLAAAAPFEPQARALPLAPSRGWTARDARSDDGPCDECRLTRPRTRVVIDGSALMLCARCRARLRDRSRADAMDRAVLIGRVDSDRRRH